MWFDDVGVDARYKGAFLEFLKSPAAVMLMNDIIYGWGDTLALTEIPIDSDEAKLCFAAFNMGILAHIVNGPGPRP